MMTYFDSILRRWQGIHAVFFIRDIVKIDLGMSHNSSGILPRLVPKTVPYFFAMEPNTTSFFYNISLTR